MQKLVIDASTAAKWQLSEELAADQARNMLRDYAAGRVTFVAPKLWQYEIANVINKAVSLRRLTETEGQQAFDALQALDIEWVDWPSPTDAYRLARTYQRSVYDSLYLDTAQASGIDLWTGDRRLYNAVTHQLPFVRWIGDYPGVTPDNHP